MAEDEYDLSPINSAEVSKYRSYVNRPEDGLYYPSLSRCDGACGMQASSHWVLTCKQSVRIDLVGSDAPVFLFPYPSLGRRQTELPGRSQTVGLGHLHVPVRQCLHPAAPTWPSPTSLVQAVASDLGSQAYNPHVIVHL